MGIDWIALASIASLLAVLVAMAGLLLETRRSRRAMQADTLFRLDERFYRQEMRTLRSVAARNLLAQKTLNQDLSDVLDLFSTIGYMVHFGALDLASVHALYGFWILRYWYASQKYIETQRRYDPYGWSNFERLVMRLERWMDKAKKPHVEVDADAIRFSLTEEARYTSFEEEPTKAEQPDH